MVEKNIVPIAAGGVALLGLLAVLAGSASYIAAPAAIRIALPAGVSPNTPEEVAQFRAAQADSVLP